MAGRYTTVKATTCYEQVLTDPAVSAVAIATPAATHFDLVRAALEAGKHVLVEKPMAPTSDQCLRLIELAQRKRATFTVAENTRFVAAYLEAAKKLGRERIALAGARLANVLNSELK